MRVRARSGLPHEVVQMLKPHREVSLNRSIRSLLSGDPLLLRLNMPFTLLPTSARQAVFFGVRHSSTFSGLKPEETEDAIMTNDCQVKSRFLGALTSSHSGTDKSTRCSVDTRLALIRCRLSCQGACNELRATIYDCKKSTTASLSAAIQSAVIQVEPAPSLPPFEPVDGSQ